MRHGNRLVLAWCVSLIAAAGGSGLLAQDSSAQRAMLTDEEVREIAAAFLAPSPLLKAMADQPLTIRTLNEGEAFPLYYTCAKGFCLTISPETGAVLSASFGGASASAYSVRTPDGRVVTKEIFRNELVKVSEQQAQNIAMQFVTDRYGSAALDGLALERPVESDNGQWFEYRFRWRNPPDEKGVYVGTQWYELVVNPVTGAVYRFLMMQNTVTLKPVRTAEDIWSLVKARASARGFIISSVKETYLRQFPGKDGKPRLVWTVVVEAAHEGGRLFWQQLSTAIDDATGEKSENSHSPL